MCDWYLAWLRASLPLQGKKAPGSGMNLYGDNRRNAQDVDEISSLFKFVVFVPPFIIEFLLLRGEKTIINASMWKNAFLFILRNN